MELSSPALCQYPLYLILCVFLSFTFSCRKAEVNLSNEQHVYDPNVNEIENVQIDHFDSTGLKYRIEAPKIVDKIVVGQWERTFPSGFEVTFYDNKNKQSSLIKSGYARFDDQFIVFLEQDVNIINPQGDVLLTSALEWDQFNGILKTNKLFKLILQSQDTIYGFGLTANENFSYYKIERGFAGSGTIK